MLPFDTTEVLRDTLRGDRRPPDGKLHPSGDLIGSLRHAQLRAAGAPTIESEIVSDVRLMTGTLWHSYFEGIFRRLRLPVMTEVKLDPWLPTGWSGTADWIAWSDHYKAFVLGDLKTIKGEGMSWIIKDGIKDEHMWQLSSYWYALEKMGLPLVKGFAVMYLPQNQPTGRGGLVDVQPHVAEGMPLGRDLVLSTMHDRWQATETYLARVDEVRPENYTGKLARNYIRKPENTWMPFLNKHLAPVQERVQKVMWNEKQKVFDLKLVPHWSAAYCPYPNELCDCREQGVTKIGEFPLDGPYKPRKGYEEHTHEVSPSSIDLKKRKEELDQIAA